MNDILDLKFADIKLLVLYKEWILLKEFEKFDNALAQKLQGKQNEQLEITEKVYFILIKFLDSGLSG